MKTLSILVATAMFALATPAEAAAPVAAESTVANQCPPGFYLNQVPFPPVGVIVVGPGDQNGDGLICGMAIGSVWILIDNSVPVKSPTKPSP